jgi:hypothetical protein
LVRSFCLALIVALLPAAAPAAEPTKVVRYVPYAPAGGMATGFLVVKRLRGYCWNESLVTPRRDAWRCMVGNDIYDPCFSRSRNVTTVACADNAFSKRLTVIALTKPLPSRESDDDSWPWGLVLANGRTCVMTTGATDAVDDMRLNYACGAGGWVVGEVDESTHPWRAFYSPRLDGKHYTKVAVREAIL